MPTFRFTATDAAGLFQSGIVEADDPLDARRELRRRGLTVRDLDEVEAPRRAAPLSLDDDPPADRPAARGRGAAPRSGGPSVLGLLALVVALATAGWVVYRDPPWGRLGRYDYTTPEAALKSDARMEARGDFRAKLDLLERLEKKEAKERADSLTVAKTVEYPGKDPKHKGKSVVFYSYKEDGKEKKNTQWFKKDEGSGYWIPTYVGLNRFGPAEKLGPREKELADEISKWEESGAKDQAAW